MSTFSWRFWGLGWLICSAVLVGRGASWERITYPGFIDTGGSGEGVRPFITFKARGGFFTDSIGWSFSLMWTCSEKVRPATLKDTKAVEVRWHSADGTVREPVNGDWRQYSATGSMGWMQASITCGFPWGRNALDEGWVEVKLPGQTLWFEIPYGFTRNPDEPTVNETKRGRPGFPASMKPGPKDRLIGWNEVIYDFGAIQNEARLSVQISGHPRPTAQVIVRPADVERAKNKPTVTARIEPDDAAALTGVTTVAPLSRYFGDQVTGFSFPPDETNGNGRSWGRMVIGVDDRLWECPIPSSLFRRDHGSSGHLQLELPVTPK